MVDRWPKGKPTPKPPKTVSRPFMRSSAKKLQQAKKGRQEKNRDDSSSSEESVRPKKQVPKARPTQKPAKSRESGEGEDQSKQQASKVMPTENSQAQAEVEPQVRVGPPKG